MKEYYYLENNEQKGPFFLDELTNQSLTVETLIWTEGLADWTAINKIPEVHNLIKSKVAPPPIPSTNAKMNLKPTNECSSDLNNKAKSDKNISRLLIWITFHLFALLMSYSRIDFFNDRIPKTDKFWPFVDYFRGVTNVMRIEDFKVRYFNGIFAYYDWSEFTFFVGGALFFYILNKLNSKK